MAELVGTLDPSELQSQSAPKDVVSRCGEKEGQVVNELDRPTSQVLNNLALALTDAGSNCARGKSKETDGG